MSLSDTDDDDSTASSKSKPHLDPRAVLALAESIPNCSRVHPPRPGGGRPCGASSAGDYGDDAANYKDGDGSPANKPAASSPSSYFSAFGLRLQQTFSHEDREAVDEERDAGEFLSFLASDVASIEQLAAAADAAGKRGSTSELEGAGIARVDVYCRTGTVITCRVIPAARPAARPAVDNVAARGAGPKIGPEEDDDASSGKEQGSSFMQMLPTPRKGNVSETAGDDARGSDALGGMQVRRIVKRRCTVEALRRILEQPPKLIEINESIAAYSYDLDDSKTSKEDNEGGEDSSQASTVSRLLLRRKQRRIGRKAGTFSKLSKEQRTFLRAQQKKYERRMRRDERVRRHVGNAILVAGMGGPGSEMGVDLTAVPSASLDDTTVTSAGERRIDGKGANEGRDGAEAESDAYRAQKAIQDKIEIADMGLAILMGEAQRLERIMAAMRDKRSRDLDTDTHTTKGSGTDTDATSRRSSSHTTVRENDDDDSQSFYTVPSRDVGDLVSSAESRGTSDDDSSHPGDASSDESSSDGQALALARLMQGCEVEYSFPHRLHDELEGALMNDDIDESSEDDDGSLDEEDNSDDVASRASSRAAAGRRRRGRSPTQGDPDGPASPTNAIRKRATPPAASPIKAVPTNGEGCVVLRENGAFDVVGKIPEVLRKKLFRPGGAMPDQIALGTLGRYYVHFMDGSFFFYGPPSLSKILIKGNKEKQRRGKDRNCVSVTSVAFGKKLDDFFVVRSDGSWETSGSLPVGLEGLMKARRGRADLLWVALGAADEWCVRSTNGRVWWEGVSDEADEALADILAEDGENELKFIDFGKDDTYFLLHK